MASRFGTELAQLVSWQARHPPVQATAPQPIKHFPQRALVLSPHPDDELIGVGGTTIEMVSSGSQVKILQLTNGKSAAALRSVRDPLKSRIRLDEAAVVAKELGADFVGWGHNDDGVLTATSKNVSALARLLTEFRPDAVFLPFINDAPPDHVATNMIFCDAYNQIAEDIVEAVYGYEVWSFCPFNCTVDITEHIHRKRELLGIYRTAMRPVDYAWRTELISAYHMDCVSKEAGNLEVFVSESPDRYVALARKTTGSRA